MQATAPAGVVSYASLTPHCCHMYSIHMYHICVFYEAVYIV